MALDLNKVDQFIKDANVMVAELSDYAAAITREATEVSAVRRLRVTVAALAAACEISGRMPESTPLGPLDPSVPTSPAPPPTVPRTSLPSQAR